MKIKANDNNFEPCPEYTGRAVCVDVTPLKKQPSQYGERDVFKVVFEVDVPREDGSRFCAWSRNFTPTLNEKAAFRKFLHGWFGRDLSEAELEDFDTETLIGKPAQLVVVHEHKDGTTFANIVACTPLKSGEPLVACGKYVRVKDRQPKVGPTGTSVPANSTSMPVNGASGGGYNRAQRILILDGEGGRGKTQFANVMQGLIGMANVTQLRTKHLAERFELYRYLKKTLLIGVDVEPDFLSTKGAAVLKGLVGGDWFDAEQKGGTGCFQMQGNFNVLITSNARLKVRLQGDVSAWKRRLNIVRYESPPPQKKIHDFGAHLVKTEGSGILNWALLGAQKVLSEIPDSGGDFLMIGRQQEIVGSFLAESDSLRHFLRERVAANSYEDLTTTEIVEAYAVYCPEKKWQPLPITEIQAKLEGLMLEMFGVSKSHSIKRNDKNQRGFHGVCLRDAIACAPSL